MMDTPHADATIWSALPDAIPAPTFKTAKRGFEREQVLQHVDRLNDRLRTSSTRCDSYGSRRNRRSGSVTRPSESEQRSCKSETGVPRRCRSPRRRSTPTSTCPSRVGVAHDVGQGHPDDQRRGRSRSPADRGSCQERDLPRAERVRRGAGHSDPSGPAGPRGSRAMSRRLGVSPQRRAPRASAPVQRLPRRSREPGGMDRRDGRRRPGRRLGVGRHRARGHRPHRRAPRRRARPGVTRWRSGSPTHRVPAPG